MKRSELFFSAIQVPVDFLMIILAGASAYYVREASFVIRTIDLNPLLSVLPFSQFMESVFFMTPFFVFIYALMGMYNIRATRKFWNEGMKVLGGTTIGLVIAIIAIFLKRQWFSSRFIILLAWLLAVLYVALGRYLLQKIQKYLLVKKGMGVHRVLLIGVNGKVKSIKKLIEKNKRLGYKIVDVTDSTSIKNIKEIKQHKGIDEIILCEPSTTDAEQEKMIDYCAINNIAYKFIPTTLQTARFEMGMLNGDPIIEIQHTPLDGWGRIAKRTIDITGAFFGIIVFGPLMAIVALLIKLEAIFSEKDGGPVIYKNERVGNDGQKFFVYKFRYMRWKHCVTCDNPELREAVKYENELIEKQSVRKGPVYKIKNDPRKTRVGAFIEKYSIDELPQFFNVLIGNMSLIGPRPHQEREVEKYQEYHRRLLTIKPGITGMAQISGRSDLNFEEEYKLDLYYIENWSLYLDMIIILKTFGVVFKKRRN